MLDKKIAVIGGGFSGTALAIHLLRKTPSAPPIDLVDPRPRPGWGVAYGDACPEHILNVPADRMSLWTEEPHAFLDWARHHGPGLGWPAAAAAGGGTYLPRRLFGHYVEAELVRWTTASGDSPLRHHGDRVIDLSAGLDGFCLNLAGGGRLEAAKVVIATGHASPAVPFPVTGPGGRFIADPWPAGQLEQIGATDAVLIIGAGLTMVDMIYSLRRIGHRGQVTVVSRHGLLPRIHGSSTDLPPVIGEEEGARGAVAVLQGFRRALAAGQGDWRSLVDSLRPALDRLWRTVPAVGQSRLLRHLRPYWEVHRHRMSAESADLLLSCLAKGGLEGHAARVEALTLTAEGGLATLRPRGSDGTTILPFAWAINCTPPAPPLASGGNDLLVRLARTGMVRAHGSGLGLDVDGEGRALDASGRPVANLFVLGPPRRGAELEVTAVPHIRPQIDALLPRLL